MSSQARGESVDAKRNVAGVAPRQPDLVTPREIERDLRARVTRADDQHAAVPQLARVPVVLGVKLNDVAAQLARERRNPRGLVAGHGDHDLGGLDGAAVGLDAVAVTGSRQAIDARAGSDRQLEARDVRLQVVGHLVLGRERISGGGKGMPARPSNFAGVNRRPKTDPERGARGGGLAAAPEVGLVAALEQAQELGVAAGQRRRPGEPLQVLDLQRLDGVSAHERW